MKIHSLAFEYNITSHSEITGLELRGVTLQIGELKANFSTISFWYSCCCFLHSNKVKKKVKWQHKRRPYFLLDRNRFKEPVSSCSLGGRDTLNNETEILSSD